MTRATALRSAAGFLLLMLCGAAPALGQRLPGNARLPMQHWSMPFLEHLVNRGALVDPSPLMRPWQVKEIVQAIHQADTTALSRAERATLRKVLRDLDGDSTPAYVAGAGGGFAASSYSRRPEFELRAAGPKRTTPEGHAMLGFQFGPGLLMADGRWDNSLEKDPDFAGTLGRWQITSDATYGLVKTRYFDLELGALSRNWGPTGFPGLLVSNWPLPYDHLFVDLGPRRLHLSMLITQLDDFKSGTGTVSKRFFVADRLAISPTPKLQIALFQGTVYSGPNQSLELAYLNPMEFTNIARTQRREETNIMLGGDAQLRTGRFLFSGSVFGDDFDFGSGEPFSFAGTATAATAIGPASVWLGYTLVSNLAYHASEGVVRELFNGLDSAGGRYGTGLARNYSDYDELTLRVSLVPLPGLIAAPEVAFLRQGEGDPRLPFPPVADYPNTPTLFVGIVERTLRTGLRATYHPFPGASIEVSGGLHHVWNDGHVAGATATRALGTVTVRYLLQFGGPIAP